MKYIYSRPFKDRLTSLKPISDILVPDGGGYNITIESNSNFGGGMLYIESSIDNVIWTRATQYVDSNGVSTPQVFSMPSSGVNLFQVSPGQIIRFNLQGATNPNIYIDVR